MNETTETTEMDDVRALRHDCPSTTADRLSPHRARLVQAFRNDATKRCGPPSWITLPGAVTGRRTVLLTAAATALGVAAGVVTVLPHDTTSDGPQVLSARASADALELAAATVESGESVTEPKPKQWVYLKSTDFDQGKPRTTESWQRWDGLGSAVLPRTVVHRDRPPTLDWTLKVNYVSKEEVQKARRSDADSRSQREFYRFLATLPTDPDAMMRRIRQEHAIGDIKGETKAERDWRELDVLYRSVLIPAKVQATMFRALAKNPDARVEKNVKDGLGRDAIGVFVNYTKRTAAGWQGKQELFFDPKTFAYWGESKDPGRAPTGPLIRTDSSRPMPTLQGTGKVHGMNLITARAAWGVVDKPGERP